MRDDDKAIAEILTRHGEDFATSVWRVQGNAVIYHKALERIAGKLGIAFDVPTVLRAERDEAVILVVGRIKERVEWSIGEAVINANYGVSGKQKPYVYAMAEKRAKDRVILKLAGLHGVYSEDEADEFKEEQPRAAPEGNSKARYIAQCTAYIKDSEHGPDDLRAWWQGEAQARRDFDLTQLEVNLLKSLLLARLNPGEKDAA